MCRQRELEEFAQVGQAAAQILPIVLSSLHKIRQSFELATPDRRLGIERLQIVAEMAVDVFVVVTLRQFAELPAEPLVARVVLARRTPAVATPVAQTLDNYLEDHVPRNTDGPTLAEREVMRRVE